jgi:class 3 adenylate cyclase
MRSLLLAARIAAHASASQVLVSQRVTEAAPPGGAVELKGFAHPVRLLEVCQA